MGKVKMSTSRKIFVICNYIFITAVTVTCMIPVLYVLALSFSSDVAIISNKVGLWPVDFTTKAYLYVLNNEKFWTAVLVTLKRVALAVPLNLFMTMLVAYPLSKSEEMFPARKYYVAFFMTTMLFSGGMMPGYFIVYKTGLINTIWALILPGCVPVFSAVLMMNFFRGLPAELEESARLDGASQFQIMTKVYLPLSTPSIATITLFSLMGHWNSYFDGLIYMNDTKLYPLQSYLQTVLVGAKSIETSTDIQELLELNTVNDTNLQSAQIFIALVPLMIVYPFLQKYFTAGLTIGSVKG